MQVLLAYGADANAVNFAGKTPAQLAAEPRSTQLAAKARHAKVVASYLSNVASGVQQMPSKEDCHARTWDANASGSDGTKAGPAGDGKAERVTASAVGEAIVLAMPLEEDKQ
jgi:hypothetical protein